MVTVFRNEHGDLSSNIKRVFFLISQTALFPAMAKIVWQTEL